MKKTTRAATGRIAQGSLLSWMFRALFSWKGVLHRLPYAGGLVLLMTAVCLYIFALSYAYATFLAPPPGNGVITPEYLIELTRSGVLSPYMLPLHCMAVLLDVKRLRSMGGPLIIAPIMAGASYLLPLSATSLLSAFAFLNILYTLALILIPPRQANAEVAASALWNTVGTPSQSGGPRRLAGSEVKNWREIAPAPGGANKNSGS